MCHYLHQAWPTLIVVGGTQKIPVDPGRKCLFENKQIGKRGTVTSKTSCDVCVHLKNTQMQNKLICLKIKQNTEGS